MKLELTWVGKENEINLEPRALIENDELSYGEKDTENLLIHGDNLLTLKALEKEYAGKIKCIYIDPPYNTKNAFEYYDDNMEHSLWLDLMYRRLKFLHRLLANNGTIWISIDNQEGHYLKILCDEIFGRDNFITDITYERSGSAGLGQGGDFVTNSEHILVYEKESANLNPIMGKRELELKTQKRYNKILKNEGKKTLIETFSSKSNGEPVKIYRHENFEIESISLKKPSERKNEIKEIYTSNFNKIFRTNNVQKENGFQMSLINKMEKKYLYTVEYTPSRGKNKNKLTTLYYYNSELFAWLKDSAFVEGDEIYKTNKLTTVWRHEEIPKADLAKEGAVAFPRSKKPEQLIKRILELATNEGDIVLDSFLGSGTTAAVAHKMKRKWIGIELGDHAVSLCKPRLDRLIDGHDKDGISKSVNWTKGGGYKFIELLPSLFIKDEFDELILNPHLNHNQINMIVSKFLGFKKYNSDCYWKQFKGTEDSYLYISNNYVTLKEVEQINKELKEKEFLIIMASSFDRKILKKFINIKIDKIETLAKDNYNFDAKNYNLNIINNSEEVDIDEEMDNEL